MGPHSGELWIWRDQNIYRSTGEVEHDYGESLDSVSVFLVNGGIMCVNSYLVFISFVFLQCGLVEHISVQYITDWFCLKICVF